MFYTRMPLEPASALGGNSSGLQASLTNLTLSFSQPMGSRVSSLLRSSLRKTLTGRFLGPNSAF